MNLLLKLCSVFHQLKCDTCAYWIVISREKHYTNGNLTDYYYTHVIYLDCLCFYLPKLIIYLWASTLRKWFSFN